jgi:hypothetical protein
MIPTPLSCCLCVFGSADLCWALALRSFRIFVRWHKRGVLASTSTCISLLEMLTLMSGINSGDFGHDSPRIRASLSDFPAVHDVKRAMMTALRSCGYLGVSDWLMMMCERTH